MKRERDESRRERDGDRCGIEEGRSKKKKMIRKEEPY